uniref:Uncharacterized protein n=1 Tax=uncultured marine microorganism HF4000_ANIW93N21 TaxID=455527 RepID=B3T358_9ZZZZ|nr:hypothetical protein ALOHA_HF4000ANIW93N21ctg1g24 [uncultured marine microorganism HF4000_ANIW93N21]
MRRPNRWLARQRRWPDLLFRRPSRARDGVAGPASTKPGDGGELRRGLHDSSLPEPQRDRVGDAGQGGSSNPLSLRQRFPRSTVGASPLPLHEFSGGGLVGPSGVWRVQQRRHRRPAGSGRAGQGASGGGMRHGDGYGQHGRGHGGGHAGRSVPGTGAPQRPDGPPAGRRTGVGQPWRGPDLRVGSGDWQPGGGEEGRPIHDQHDASSPSANAAYRLSLRPQRPSIRRTGGDGRWELADARQQSVDHRRRGHRPAGGASRPRRVAAAPEKIPQRTLPGLAATGGRLTANRKAARRTVGAAALTRNNR